MIRWVGEADWWNGGQPLPVPDEYRYVFPLTEEAVPKVAAWFEPGVLTLSLDACETVTNRFLFRQRLTGKSINVDWGSLPYRGGVLKATRSCKNNGVVIARDAVLWEEYIPGPQYEQDGLVLDNHFFWFRTLRQAWSDDQSKILFYQIVAPPYGLRNTVVHAIQAVGLNNCPFCVELRLGHDDWKVIEVNARLGEDPGLPFLLWPTHPLRQVERWAAEQEVRRGR